MEKTPVAILNEYFNKDENGKSLKPIGQFNNELKALDADEKLELATLAAPLLGHTVKA